MPTFHVKVDDGPIQAITVKSSLYIHAAAAVPALLDAALPSRVEIWVPNLVPEYGPYIYRVEMDVAGNVIVSHDPFASIHEQEVNK